MGTSGRSPLLAGILSFLVTGLGQLYNGEIQKGLMMFVGVMIGAMVLNWFLFGICSLGLMLWSVTDAYQVAKRK
jgi:TM2 domain-containing membrane protein YozV